MREKGIVTLSGVFALVAIMVVGGSGLSLSLGTIPGQVVAVPSPAAALHAPGPGTPSSGSAKGLSDRTCADLKTSANDPQWARTQQEIKNRASDALAAGLRSSDLHLPYAGSIPDQVVNGVMTPGDLLESECHQGNTTSAIPLPSGVAYDGQNDTNGTVLNQTIDSNSIDGILNVNSSNNFYPDSATPNLWGAQLNAVLANVTILGHNGYFFWVQNVVSYDSRNDTISFVDDTWNFTAGGVSGMQTSSLVSWSPNGGNYTGVWVAYSPYIYCPPPFTVNVYVNTSVDSAGEQVLWYNYSVLTNGHFYANGNYDYLVFRSQAPTPVMQHLLPPSFEASGTQTALVNEGYEFDSFIGADDGSDNLILGVNATEQLKYCSLGPHNDCTPSDFAYSNVPAAVNYGSQTGEQTIGVDVGYKGTTAYISGGPLIANGLWGYRGLNGSLPGNTKVVNAISATGSPLALTSQPYFFVFFNNPATGIGYAWAPDVPDWYLMPGTYDYEIMLSDYAEQSGAITVGSSTVTLTATLPYSPESGVYTPLWAFGNSQVAGISTSGSGTISDQYILFNNPTSNCVSCGSAANGNLSSIFYNEDDYTFNSFPGLFIEGTNAYIDANNSPSFSVGSNGNYSLDLNIQFYETSHVTLSDDQGISGWSEQEEIGFYATVPASQNPAPQADVYVWDSMGDLIMSNDFEAVAPVASGYQEYVSPDGLVLYGGSHNVVWGNTFEDPTNSTLGSTYAGIGEDEGGDLIYNNNFTIDNPVVYLPYNYSNVADCLPQSLGGCANNATGNPWFYNTFGNTWNVTPQAATNVTDTVNGFALSGNVLGSFYPTQGGNYYWNYGLSPNNYSTNPYVNRFYYSDWSYVFPLGCGSVQAPGAPCGTAPALVGAYEDGMHIGGDYVPLKLAIGLEESGLPAGTDWSASLNSVSASTNSTVIAWGQLETGSYSYVVDSVPGYTATPSSGHVTLNGPRSTPYKIVFTRTASKLVISSFTASPSKTVVSAWTNLTVNFTGGSGTIGYAYTGLPQGCKTADLEVLPCQPLVAGNFTIRVFVNDSIGDSANDTTSLTVTQAAPTLVSVSISPGSKGVEEGNGLIFEATAVCSSGTCPIGTTFKWHLSNGLGKLNSTTGPTIAFSAGDTLGTVNLTVNATLDGKTVQSSPVTITIVNVVATSGGNSSWLTDLYIVVAVVAILIAVAALYVRSKRSNGIGSKGGAAEGSTQPPGEEEQQSGPPPAMEDAPPPPPE